MPRLSLGLPVYNGERFLREAIDSILTQTFDDFELVICDNASTDSTGDIAREYAGRDPRVRYHRNPENIGAGPNFNRAFELANQGEYFKWVAHDDVHEPTFLERCVAILDESSDVTIAYSKVRVIDQEGKTIEDYPFCVGADTPSPWRRMRGQIRGHQCYEIFGVIRRAALERTPVMGDYFAGDAVLLIRLGLMGRLVEVPEHLFRSRRHDTQSDKLKKNVQEYTTWFQPKAAGKITLPYWRVLREYLVSVWRAKMPLGQKIPCTWLVFIWGLRRWKRLSKDVVRACGQIYWRTVHGRRARSAAEAR